MQYLSPVALAAAFLQAELVPTNLVEEKYQIPIKIAQLVTWVALFGAVAWYYGPRSLLPLKGKQDPDPVPTAPGPTVLLISGSQLETNNENLGRQDSVPRPPIFDSGRAFHNIPYMRKRQT